MHEFPSTNEVNLRTPPRIFTAALELALPSPLSASTSPSTMSSAHSYERGLHDLEKELDSAPKVRRERSSEAVPKKEGFVRTVGFKSQPEIPASHPPTLVRISALIRRWS